MFALVVDHLLIMQSATQCISSNYRRLPLAPTLGCLSKHTPGNGSWTWRRAATPPSPRAGLFNHVLLRFYGGRVSRRIVAVL